MSVTGTVKGGKIVLPKGTKLPEGARVSVEVIEKLTGEDKRLTEAVLALAKPRPYWPDDYALNHGHYLKGEPKK
jgi:hypothetical protein